MAKRQKKTSLWRGLENINPPPLFTLKENYETNQRQLIFNATYTSDSVKSQKAQLVPEML